MTDSFSRDHDTIREQFVIACGRRTHATQELHRAIADVEQAEQALLRAEQEVLLRERHVAMCDRSIEGLLDEELHAAGARV